MALEKVKQVKNPPSSHARSTIPPYSWQWPLGKELENPGRNKAPFTLVGDDGPWGGVPLGGFGSGSVGRTPRGDFARWHLRVGWHDFRPLPGCMTAVRFQEEGKEAVSQALWTEQPADGSLSGWQWNYPREAGRYCALYPKAWFEFDHRGWPIRMTQEQFSPILPDNYRESSFPVGAVNWRVENRGERQVTVTLLFTWQHSVAPNWQAGPVSTYSEVRSGAVGGEPVAGVTVRNFERGEPSEDWQGSFALAALGGSGVELSTQSRFDTAGDGSDLWQHFTATGILRGSGHEASGEDLGVGVAATFVLQPGENRTISFALSWDFPLMSFGGSQGQEEIDGFFAERESAPPMEAWYRRYTQFWGRSGGAAWNIAQEALDRGEEWLEGIARWHESIPADRPDWFRGALFNELYYLTDGGTAWEAGRAGAPAPAGDYLGRFTYLECFDYAFYSTLDVRFYASWALLMNWPRLELQVMRQFIPTVEMEDTTPYITMGSNSPAVRKLAGALPHDLGAPFDAPWDRPNAYTFQDINIWKDLNSKYVLLIYRDALITGDETLISEAWPGIQRALAYLQSFDRDGDTLPDNDDLPDQTYDTWRMKGLSAYCGGLWLAALRAAVRMAELLGDQAAAEQYRTLFVQGQPRFESALWNGRYYNYDTEGEHHDVIMADQLCGQWYVGACGLDSIVPTERARTALETIFEYNVMRFAAGRRGAVNGMLPSGEVDHSSEQSEEVWTGSAYALAALMLQEGLDDEAWKSAWGIYHTTYEDKGLWFRTPEAWNLNGDFRAALYMRPQAIWAIEHALRLRARER